MKSITIFTPTYNRGFALTYLYESLQRQINDDFIWLIIDDGSNDDTWDLVEEWIFRKEISIKYIKQENLGMHVAHNVAYENVETEFVMCVDSDDYLPDYSIDLILQNMRSLEPQHAGIVGLCVTGYGITIGTEIPEEITETTLHDLYTIHKVTGHKKVVYRNSVVKEFPKYPIFPGEKWLPLSILYAEIDQKYLMKTLNEPLSVTQYPDDRYSKNLFLLQLKNLHGFVYSSLQKLRLYKDFKSQLKHTVLLLVYSKFLQDPTLLIEPDDKRFLILAKPFALLYYRKMKKISNYEIMKF